MFTTTSKTQKVQIKAQKLNILDLTPGVHGAVLETAGVSPNPKFSCVLYPKYSIILKPAVVPH